VRTTIPAHQVLLDTDDFRAVNHSTNWVEDEVDQSQFAAAKVGGASEVALPAPEDGAGALVERTVPVEVDGRRYSVKVWLPDAHVAARTARGRTKPKPSSGAHGTGATGGGTVSAPMQGTIVKVLVEVGQEVEAGEALLVLEAMKMENHINAEKSGTVAEIRVGPGDGVGTGDILAVIE
jgi:acetyl-CoA/propionyl-CoA/long-chain acyl-CoA carboxylase, biotin carboxylase, biotin carboxyl carrier protein